jgi:hypothetical protein
MTDEIAGELPRGQALFQQRQNWREKFESVAGKFDAARPERARR